MPANVFLFLGVGVSSELALRLGISRVGPLEGGATRLGLLHATALAEHAPAANEVEERLPRQPEGVSVLDGNVMPPPPAEQTSERLRKPGYFM